MELPQHIGNRPARQRGAPHAGEALSDTADRPPIRSLYIHTPFCVHKCHYCDFYSFVDTRDRQAAFVERLIGELRAVAPFAAGRPLRTVFVGGGTPSLLRVGLWERLLGALDELFDLSLIRSGGAADGYGLAEFTVECNPESTTADLLGVLRAGGVNRVSIGAQSFDPRHLKTLERWHDPENVARAVELAQAAGIARQSVDLIFAIPGQTIDEWARDLARARSLGTTHLSCYNLTYEPNTAMTRRMQRGEFEPIDADTEADMYELTLRTLAEGRGAGPGLHRYEVSNFAAPGHESRHNLAYWLQDQWLAAGPSASGHAWAGADMRAGSHRWKNVPRLGEYLDGEDGFSPMVDHEPPAPRRLIRERIMMGLRLTRGLDARSLLSDADALGAGDALRESASRLRDRGLMLIDGDHARWRLTDAGMLLADALAGELMRAVPP